MPMIKDPTYNVYAKGGNVENRTNTPKKDELIKLAKDIKDIEFVKRWRKRHLVIRLFETKRKTKN